MNCERFEELLIDFMEGEIDPSEGELVKKHLVTCPSCSKKLEEYEEIRRIFNEETFPQPSPQVLAGLSKVAREEVRKDRPPFWKKWFYSPILVPVLSSALALFIWIYYGQKNIGYSPSEDMYSREAMAKKVPIAQEPSLPGVREGILEDIESKGRTLSSNPSAVSPQASGKKERIQEESGLSSELAPTEELVAKKAVEEADKSSADETPAGFETRSLNELVSKQPTKTEEESLGRLEERAEEKAREDKEKSKEVKLYAYRGNVYNEQLNLALKQQKEGNCEASIKTNEELLKASPSPPESVKEKAYLSLAECYEQKRDWDSAILNYQNLQEVAPKQTIFAKDKIEALRQKISFLKARELKPSDSPEEGQKSK